MRRLPFVPSRCVRLMRLLSVAALLLALFAPAGGWAAPEAENGLPESPTPAPEADVDALPHTEESPAPTAPASLVPLHETAEPSLSIPEGGLALTPFLEYLIDPSGSLDIAQVSAPERESDFRPFEAHAPFRQAGAVWLRFRLAPASSASASTAGPAQTRLDLGGQVPGEASVWTRVGAHPPVPAAAEGGLFPLAGLSGGGEVFVRLDGLPGLWFAPALRTVSDSLTTLDRRVQPLLLAALTALLLLCLVRSVTERGDGRLWAGVLTGSALLHALWGVPATPRGTVIPFDMPGLLAAGVALMLLPHVGRNIKRTRDTSPRLDVLLLVLALPGAALAVLPLLPGLAWTARLFDLWPLGAAFALVPALLLLARGIPGSGLYSLACLGLVAGGGLAVWGVNGGLTAPLWGQAALAGVVFASLLLAAAAPRSAYADPAADTTDTPGPDAGIPDPLRPDDAVQPDPARSLRLEEILRGPLDTLLREACSLDQLLERPDERRPLTDQDARQARRHADNLVAAAREMSTLVTDLPRLARRRSTPDGKRQIFDLLKLVRSVFTDVGDARQKGELGLSWYIAPHLGRLYKGDRERLRFVLAMLLENAARATDRGAVSLRVRRADMSPDPGHLQFTVADTGSGTPPLRRSSLALAKAWELAADHGGDLFVDSTPHGVEITFSLACVALADDGQTPRPVPPIAVGGRREGGDPNPRLVILAASRPLTRQMLAFFLEDQGQEIWEARDAEEAAALYTHTPAALVVFDGRLPEEDIVTAVAAIRAFEGERSLPAAPFLALTLDEEQAERLHQAGCDHSLPLPVVRGEFRAMSLHLASPSGVKPRPSVVPYRVPPARPRRASTPAPSVAASRPESPVFSPLELLPLEAPARNAASGQAEPRPTAETAPATRPSVGQAVLSPPMSADEQTASAPVPVRKPHGPIETPRPEEATSASSPDASASTTPPAVTPTRRSPAPAAGLNLPPNAGKRMGWLNRLLKPTPRIAPSALPEDAASGASSEWVGEPMPITTPSESVPAGPHSASRPSLTDPASGTNSMSSPAAIPVVTPASASAPESPTWYSPYEDDPECSVGDPMPVPSSEDATRTMPEPASDRVTLEEQAEDAPEQEEAFASPAPGKAESARDEEAAAASPEGSGDIPPSPTPPEAVPEPAVPACSELPNQVNAPAGLGESSERPPLLAPGPKTPEAVQAEPAPAAPPRFSSDEATADIVATVSAEAEAEPTSAADVPLPVEPVAAPGRMPAPRARVKRRKNRLEDLPFLSLDPNYTPPRADGTNDDNARSGEERGALPPAASEEDDIVDLTEAEMVDSPLLQQVPDLLRSLDAAVEHAAGALERRDPWGLINAADRMADRAVAFGLHALSDLALCLKEAAQQRDFDTAAQLLPELRAEVARHRRNG